MVMYTLVMVMYGHGNVHSGHGNVHSAMRCESISGRSGRREVAAGRVPCISWGVVTGVSW
jgi:hypothetical protein